jgi:hypothetical protein
VRSHSAWALGQIPDLQAKTKLEEAKITEKNPEVLQEIEAALAAFSLKAVDQVIFTD